MNPVAWILDRLLPMCGSPIMQLKTVHSLTRLVFFILLSSVIRASSLMCSNLSLSPHDLANSCRRWKATRSVASPMGLIFSRILVEITSFSTENPLSVASPYACIRRKLLFKELKELVQSDFQLFQR
ncbi:hypothetical protein Leryth_004152 [Lithospermum erythrorhizon]|nr:hypothetical protein Leryth_004152 [Lithospermum erythrorhizon]